MRKLKVVGTLVFFGAVCCLNPALAQQFEVDKIPAFPGAYNSAMDGDTACDILSCAGQGNGFLVYGFEGEDPASIVVSRWTSPGAPELQPYYEAGFVGVNNCVAGVNSSCPAINGHFPSVLAKHWDCPAGYTPSITDPFKCIRTALDPAKNNECDATTGPTQAGNPINFLTGAKIETSYDYRAPSGHLELGNV